MGVIRRQGIKKSLILYFGVLIGIASTLYIYPLEEDIYGLARFLLSMAGLLAPFLSWGVNSLAIRFFPVFRDKQTGHQGFLGLLLLLSTSCFVLLGTILFYSRSYLYELLRTAGMDVAIFSKNLLETGILALLIINATIVTSYISNFRRITVPGIFNSLYVKIGIPVLVLLYYFQKIQVTEFKAGLIILHALIFVSLLIYTFYLGELYLRPRFSFLSGKLIKSMFSYSSYGVFASLGATIAFRIDTIMTASLMGFASTGVYSIADNIAGVIATPFKSINEISAPIFAQHMNDREYDKVSKLYKSSAITLLIVGLGLLISIYVSIDSIFSLSAQYDTLIQGEKVVLLLGLAKVVDMSTGLNTYIISYSHLYKWGLVWMAILCVLNIGFNLTFIPEFGITGAALATLLSMIISNIIRFIFVWVKFKMQPFGWGSAWVVVIGGLAYILGSIIPGTGYHLLDIIVKSGITFITFGGLVWYFNFSPDISNFASMILARVRRFTGI